MIESSVPAQARVQSALEASYRLFAAPPPSIIEGCPCCIEERGVDVLLTTPLWELSGKDLWSYVSGVFYTIGSERDFKYLLPRILDIAINDPGNSNDPEIVLGKVGLANWLSWPRDERAAIEELVDSWFELALTRDLADAGKGWIGTETEAVLCGAARLDLPLSRWLKRLQEPDATPVLKDLRERFPEELSAFWEYAPAGLEELSGLIGRA